MPPTCPPATRSRSAPRAANSENLMLDEPALRTRITSVIPVCSRCRLLAHGDRLPEGHQAVGEEREADDGHHQELDPDRADAAAAVDDDLREADEVARRQEV